VVQKGNLSIYARGIGTLGASNETKLGFGTNGVIADIMVKVGDKVTMGDILAVQSGREQYEAAAAADKLTVLYAEQTLKTNNDESGLVSAQAQTDLINEEGALARAMKIWRSTQSWNQSPSFFVTAEVGLESTMRNLTIARSNYTKYSYLPSDNSIRSSAEASLPEAQKEFNSALLALLSAYPAEIRQTKNDIPLTMAAARVVQAQRTWEAFSDDSGFGKVAIAEQELASAKATYGLSQSKLDNSRVVAPMDGVLLSVLGKKGDNVSGPFITMADSNQRFVTTLLDGTDIGKVAVDHKVEVIFDALPNQIFTGRITQIDPNLYTPAGDQILTQTPGQVTMIKILVSLEETTSNTIQTLPLGMTATVNVVGNETDGVILIPIQALIEQAPGKYSVLVIENGLQKSRSVEVGLMDFSYAEIKSGLSVGEIVVISK